MLSTADGYELNVYLFSICAGVYATLSLLIAVQAKQNANVILAFACGLTATWALSGVVWSQPELGGAIGLLDMLRLLVWYIYLLYLYKRSDVGSEWQIRGFCIVAISVLVAGLVAASAPKETLSYTLFSLPVSARLFICICELLLIENLYLNLPETARWHIAIPCVLLGGLACFDILVIADTALFRRPSVPLASGRAIAMVIVAPLLVLAALRGQRWSEPIRLSRAAAFHSATLVLSGSVLLALALTGEVLRHLDETWGWVAELSLVFSGLIGIMLFLSSRSARSIVDQLVVYHFFADRYDYRTQWLGCINTLSGKGIIERTNLQMRAIRAVADVVNSPSGALFLRNNAADSMVWTTSWNMPVATTPLLSHSLMKRLASEQRVVQLSEADCGLDPFQDLGPLWLAVPLLHSSGIIGVVVVGPPRVFFRLDQEVFDLLGILGQEVGMYIAEQKAAEAIVQTRSLHEYGKRFAFVAHDIKNVSSQLALILSNAEHHLHNPEFQRDMLETVRSSVQKIDRLLKRLDEPKADSISASITPMSRLEAMVETYQRVHDVSLTLETNRPIGQIDINPDAFDTAITHLLNNAVEAEPKQPVLIKLAGEAGRVLIEITDRGAGMSPEFVRDELFSPFKTKKHGGSGIGAFQARELINEAGGELLVISQEGAGTTIRISFPSSDRHRSQHITKSLDKSGRGIGWLLSLSFS